MKFGPKFYLHTGKLGLSTADLAAKELFDFPQSAVLGGARDFTDGIHSIHKVHACALRFLKVTTSVRWRGCVLDYTVLHTPKPSLRLHQDAGCYHLHCKPKKPTHK